MSNESPLKNSSSVDSCHIWVDPRIKRNFCKKSVMVILEKVAEGGLADEENKITMETTAASEETVTEKIAENPAAENTEVETVSGDTVSAEPKVQTTANSAEDEAGIAVQPDDGTASDLIEVTIGNNVCKYSTFDEAMNAIDNDAGNGALRFKVKLLGDVENVTRHDFDSVGQEVDISFDLNDVGVKSPRHHNMVVYALRK